MDVHPPSERVQSWKDFAIHLAIVTLGLLIALGLEAAVEWGHHRELVVLTRERLREEITGSLDKLHLDRTVLKAASDQMESNIRLLRQLQADKAHASGKLILQWQFNGFGN